jgi:phosphopantothenoylcysteine decarboxylase/phosphopantothenate--cysteine ligase
MSILSGKNILLGITGGIAAYKTTYLVRHFIKAGAHVKVIMTPASIAFVTPLTLSTLSKNPVLSSFTNEDDENDVWNNHVDLGLWADLFIIAPATANTMSKMATGNSDNFLLATYLSAKCPVYFAPAMDLDMYKHSSTKKTFEILKSFGNTIIPAGSGELASGLVGEGRMAEPEDILSFIEADVLSKLPLRNKKVLITAGPTYEAIDPVRFIGNHSSGKMGFELANVISSLGAEVVLISGPTKEVVSNSLVKVLPVVSAEEMYEVVHEYYPTVDIAICAAAVADYKPQNIASQKNQKEGYCIFYRLSKNKRYISFFRGK